MSTNGLQTWHTCYGSRCSIGIMFAFGYSTPRTPGHPRQPAPTCICPLLFDGAQFLSVSHG